MNNRSLILGKFSLGVGDRFAQEADAQLRACMKAAEHGARVIPVWNKSNREHMIIGSEPSSVRDAAAVAVGSLGWKDQWHTDADHIRLETVDRFISSSDFFTIDVADAIGKRAEPEVVRKFIDRHDELIGDMEIPGIERGWAATRSDLEHTAYKYLAAVQEAGAVYRHIESAKGRGNFIPEISMDETDAPQTPMELLTILAAIAGENIPVQTLAPKFTGRFHKGVDYVGDVTQFEREFGDDLCVVAFAVRSYGLPANLKLSVHSGSDKFSIYPAIRRGLVEHGAGLHLKTAGTSWLEEVIGLAESGGEGLGFVKELYAGALARIDELCAPYATVIDIDRGRLPASEVVDQWTSEQYVNALRHEPSCKEYNPHLRQLLHVGFKVAAAHGARYHDLLRSNRAVIAKNVTDNLFERHIRPIFLPAELLGRSRSNA